MISNSGDASLVRAGATAIAEWRTVNPAAPIVAAGAEFRGLDLSGVNLAGADLRHSQFVACDLHQASFAGASLARARFADCSLIAATFSGADLRNASLDGVKLDGTRFNGTRGLGRLAVLRVSAAPSTPPLYNRSESPLIDRWLGWDRLRFLTTIRIFVPAYASLTLSVLYLNAIAWYNDAATRFDTAVGEALPQVPLPALGRVSPNWTHAAIIINFLLLAIAATAFLGCPARVVEFSRERWLSEMHEPELFYDHAVWQRPWLRCMCAVTLGLGGILSTFLLGRGIIEQIAFILAHVISTRL